MCVPDKKFTRGEVYEAIQATIACVQKASRTWILKIEDEDGGLYFEIAPKLDLAKYKINIIDLGGESVKLKALIDQALTKALIRYRAVNFLPYPPNVTPPKNKFFNLLPGFLAKPAKEIVSKIMDPIHTTIVKYFVFFIF